MGKHIIYVGLDVHKDPIAIALAETGKRGEVREHGARCSDSMLRTINRGVVMTARSEIKLSSEERETLERCVRRRKTGRSMAKRVEIILRGCGGE